MFGAVGGTGLTVVLAHVLTYAVVDASTSTVHAFLDRIESALNEARRPALSQVQRAAVILDVLIVASVLSRFGVIALVAQGYTYLAYGFLVVFVLPLLTRGVRLIWRQTHQVVAEEPAASSAIP